MDAIFWLDDLSPMGINLPCFPVSKSSARLRLWTAAGLILDGIELEDEKAESYTMDAFMEHPAYAGAVERAGGAESAQFRVWVTDKGQIILYVSDADKTLGTESCLTFNRAKAYLLGPQG